jgi:hypothetical protein
MKMWPTGLLPSLVLWMEGEPVVQSRIVDTDINDGISDSIDDVEGRLLVLYDGESGRGATLLYLMRFRFTSELPLTRSFFPCTVGKIILLVPVNNVDTHCCGGDETIGDCEH